jgi:hypothetical protein
MKLWRGFGSEHSMKLVMIGRFRSARDAEKTKELIDQLVKQVSDDPDAYRHDAAPEGHRFTDAMLALLRAADLYSLGPSELEQFSYDATVKVKGSEVIVKTDEVDVSAFLKVLLDKGARIEVYSAHEYPDTGY